MTAWKYGLGLGMIANRMRYQKPMVGPVHGPEFGDAEVREGDCRDRRLRAGPIFFESFVGIE